MKKPSVSSFDGVRGIASLMVILSHCVMMFTPQLHKGVELSDVESVIFNFPFKFFYNGSAAVGIFFVLSGVVLSLSIINKGFSYDYIRDAALKRYIRLGFPVFFSVLICFAMMHFGVFQIKSDVAKHAPLAAEFLFEPSLKGALWDGLFGSMLFGGTPYNYVLWTISVEFYGSLMVYAVLALFGRDKQILRAVSFGVFVFLTFHPNDFAVFYGLFMAGVFISTFEINYISTYKTKALSIMSLLCGLYLMGYAPSSQPFHYMYKLFAGLEGSGVRVSWMLPLGLGSILVISSIYIDYCTLGFLSKQPFKFIGKMSFSVYLLHPIILATVGPYIYELNGQTFKGMVIAIATVTFITLCVSPIFYALVDKKSITLSARFADFIDRSISRKKITEQSDMA